MIIHVRVKPNAKTNSIDIKSDGAIHIRISAAPVDGEANKYLVKYLSGIFKIAQSKIEITKGHNNSYKTIFVHADEDYVNDILEGLTE